MSLSELTRTVERTLRSNSPAVLAGLAVSGTITTAYLAHQVGYQVGKESRPGFEDQSLKDRFALLWKSYIPTTVSGIVTVGCIVAGTRVSTRRAAAAYSLVTISEKAFTEYKEKVIEKFGENKEQAVRDEIAQDRVKNNPPTDQQIVIAGPGNVLCCELHTGRYFHSDMETLRKAQNEINAKLLREDSAVLTDFYYILKLPATSTSWDVGWTSARLMELKFSTVMSEDSRPYIAFEYNYLRPID